MKYLYANKPLEAPKSQLPQLDAFPIYIAQQKGDGWRCKIIRDKSHESFKGFPAVRQDHVRNGEYLFLSRRGMKDGGPTVLPVSDEVASIIYDLKMPDMSMLDSEWMARRSIGELPESLFVFDVDWFGDEWWGSRPCGHRWNYLLEFMAGKTNPIVKVPEATLENYSKFFEDQQKYPFCEGIVLKNLMSTIISDREKSPKNPGWLKVKWRAGSDGRETFNI